MVLMVSLRCLIEILRVMATSSEADVSLGFSSEGIVCPGILIQRPRVPWERPHVPWDSHPETLCTLGFPCKDPIYPGILIQRLHVPWDSHAEVHVFWDSHPETQCTLEETPRTLGFSCRDPMYPGIPMQRAPIPWDSHAETPCTLGFSPCVARPALVTLTSTQKSPTCQIPFEATKTPSASFLQPLLEMRGQSCVDCSACVELLINCSLITACSRGF